ncbi:lactate permease [Skermanella aerolata]|jgi:lactate permease|uniref:L-lactate permease n=1 Tax=Skermanella aerolata TaxID=393310 RepID=A0A512DHY9_9PROT|nr:L-lactate permease [Skermanella aerolata]KJB97630.1 lactate permease [Skermanella aerolata KACC 11604]GEO36109.1 L-lactate permease [Skermanella aerolata]
MWPQVYDPFGSMLLSTLVAAIPIVVLLGAIGLFHMKAHYAAGLGLLASLAVAIVGFGMPVGMASMSAVYGAAYGMLPIGWIILNVIFLYQLTSEKGEFTILQDSIASITRDRRLQLLLIAFCFGAFFEGAAGFGTPVAVTGAMLIGLGFSPLAASGLSLIANTAPVAYGALGTPIIALSAVTGLDLLQLSGMIGRQLPFFSVIVPFWLIWAFVGFRGMMSIWPALVVAGVSFALPQYLVSNFHGPWLVDVVAAIVSMAALALFLRGWKPRELWLSTTRDNSIAGAKAVGAQVVHDSEYERRASQYTRGQVIKAWVPWIILSVFVFMWGVPQIKVFLDSIWILKIPVEGLHNLVQKVPPVVAAPLAEPAIYSLNLMSATGTGIFLAAIVSGFVLGYSPLGLIRMYFKTFYLIRFSLLTIAGMLALGYVTKYSGTDATLGLAFAQTGWLYPLFGTMLGWLGVALTGSDTASNVLFGGLQKITSEQLGLNPVLMASANSSGGVMGKMIDAQSIVVASTATRWYGHEGDILRYVFFHSLALAVLVGLLVMAQAYVWPFTALVY